MNIAGYVRLSRDEDKENYSSIETQKEIIREYAAKFQWNLSKFYVDDNYSGYTFNRPGFKQMREDLESGRIDLILSKDLSRIGRHNAKVLLFLEEVREMGRNLILIEEGPDGYNVMEDNDDAIGIKTWYNERYVKDISKKVRSSMRIKQKKGELIMGNPYGYLKDPVNRFVLRIDPNVSPAVELIFRLYLQGYGYKKICDVLNERGYPTPSENLRIKHREKGRNFNNAVSEKWQTHAIQRIISNDLYVGTLRTHKKQNRRVKGKQVKVPAEEQFVFPGHHEAIISREDFETAQQIRKKRAEGNFRGNAKHPYLFSSFIYCGECGYAATGKNLSKRPHVTLGYECTQYSKYGLKGCISHNMPEDCILLFFREFLKDVGREYAEFLEQLRLTSERPAEEEADVLRKELEQAKEELKFLINQRMLDGMKKTEPEYHAIMEKSYDELEQEKKRKIQQLNLRLSELLQINSRDERTDSETALQVLEKMIVTEKPDRKDLELILDRINIYGKSNDSRIEFKLKLDLGPLAENDDITFDEIT